MLTEEQRAEVNAVRKNFRGCFGKAEYEVEGPKEFMLPVSEEICLRTIVFRPVTTECVPTIVARSAYPQFECVQRAKAEEYAKRGFAYIYQYCRGVGGSEGKWIPNENERHDGKILIDWVCSQSWVKNVGFLGSSYLALTGWVIADILPSKVKTMYLTHYGTMRHTSAYQEGAFRQDILTAWAMGNAGFPITADYEASCMYRPHIAVDTELWGKKLDWYRAWIMNPGKEDLYWQEGFWKLLREIPHKIKIPLFIGEGWFDHHLQSALETYDALSDECKAKSTLCIGGWNHGFADKLEGHECKNFGNNDDERAFRWFYKILAEEKEPEGSIETYVIGEDRWYKRPYNASLKIQKMNWYLFRDIDRKVLVKEPDRQNGMVTYCYDPENPVRSQGGEALMNSRKLQGSLLQPEADYREDVLSFMSDVLEEGLLICGRMKMHLSVQTDVEDTAFAVKVIEVFPDQTAYNLRTGITTLGYRNGSASYQNYQPGEREHIEIVMWDINWKLQEGSRIRVDITSSDFPQYAVHANQAGCWAMQKETQKAHQKIFYGKGYPSYLELPVSIIE